MKDNFKLSDIPKHNIYQVPENYFERLPMRVMERTEAAPAGSWSTGFMWQPLRMLVAPLVLLLVFLGVFYLNIPAEQAIENKGMASLRDQEIMDYLNTYATLDNTDFAELNSIKQQELAADVLNVSSKDAEAELEYYHINQIDY